MLQSLLHKGGNKALGHPLQATAWKEGPVGHCLSLFTKNMYSCIHLCVGAALRSFHLQKINELGGRLAIMGPPGQQRRDGNILKHSRSVLGVGGGLRWKVCTSASRAVDWSYPIMCSGTIYPRVPQGSRNSPLRLFHSLKQWQGHKHAMCKYRHF